MQQPLVVSSACFYKRALSLGLPFTGSRPTQKDVREQDDDERLARVADVGEDALPRQLEEGDPPRVENQYQDAGREGHKVGHDVGEGRPVLRANLLAQVQPEEWGGSGFGNESARTSR